MRRTVIAAAAVVAAVASAPVASADEYSFISTLENSSTSVYYGPRINFIEAGYRVCRQVGMGYSAYDAAMYLLRINDDLDPSAAGELAATAVIHLC